ncbi:MAG: tRNA (adenosine(37)-N6)-threonylcarbamoyltransferase complex dimerization subunit type 1 TsaB [Actinomycetota bacterium]|nr:tRNA (adenosine(37)-N6)-threonylcarbamoyltransferase complex dimerization subunit type 1 TsaB [Actinomycetota bacterium]
MLVLAFDTATDVATSALVDDGSVLGERTSIARTLLEDVDALLRDARAAPRELEALVVGTGPGSFTSTRIGLALAQGLALALDLPVAGVSTLDALTAARDGAYPVIDARRREVFVAGPAVVAPDDLDLEPAVTCIGSGAIRYRETLEGKGAVVPPDDDEIHLPHARLHAALARDFGPADAVIPLYVRSPDAKAPISA